MVENYLGPCFGMMLSILGRKSCLHDSMVLGSSYSWNPLPLSILVKQEAETGPEIGLDTNFKALPGTRDLPLTKLCFQKFNLSKQRYQLGLRVQITSVIGRHFSFNQSINITNNFLSFFLFLFYFPPLIKSVLSISTHSFYYYIFIIWNTF